MGLSIVSTNLRLDAGAPDWRRSRGVLGESAAQNKIGATVKRWIILWLFNVAMENYQ